MCSAIDFPLYVSHDLFTYKSGRLHTAGGGLMTKFYVCRLFNKGWCNNCMCFHHFMRYLLFGKALQTSTVSVREAFSQFCKSSNHLWISKYSVLPSGAVHVCLLFAPRRHKEAFSGLFCLCCERKKWLICSHNYVGVVEMEFIRPQLFFFLPQAYQWCLQGFMQCFFFLHEAVCCQ